MLNRILSRGAIATLAVAAVPMAALAAVHALPATGPYASSKSHKSIQFDVAKKGSGREIKDFGIYCKSGSNSGAVLAMHDMTVTKSGKFSYKGKARRVSDGVPSGTATLTVSGKFVTATKAKGTASFTAKPRLVGCPAKAFTATKSA